MTWIDPEANPNGIGPVCKHCHLLIDWHPLDHAPDCPEYVECVETWQPPHLARVILFLAERSTVDTFPEDIQDAIDWAKDSIASC